MTIEEAKELYIGLKSRNLTILDIFTRPRKHSRTGMYNEKMARCQCSCGNIHDFRLSDVLNDAVGSCGCLRDKAVLENIKLANQAYKEKYCLTRRGNTYTYLNNGIIQVDSHHDPTIKFYVDDITWAWLHVFTWSVSQNGYVYTCVNYRNFSYHNIIISCPPGYTRDHINRNRNDNTYKNLRITTYRGNMLNRDMSIHNPYGVTGITRPYQKWVATGITSDGEILRESFDTKQEAINRREEIEQEHYQIEEIETPKLILPYGTLNYQNFRWDWYPAEYDNIWNFFGIQVVPTLL